MGFHGGQLGGLQFGHHLALDVAAQGESQHQHQTNGSGHAEGAAEEFHVALAQQVPGRHAQHEEAGQRPGGEQGVGVHAPGVGVGDHGHEVGQFGAAVLDHIAQRVLHEAVGQDDPQGGQVAGQHHQPDGQQMGLLAHAMPAEMPDSQKRGLQEEGHSGFDGQQGAEDVAHVFRIPGPVGPELEFQGDARHHAQGEVDDEKFAPELGMLAPDLIPGAHIAGLHQRDEQGQAQRQRHEDEVEKDGHGEL